jgi:hypothetical protein
MDLRRQAILLGRARFVVGLSMLATPRRSATVWSGAPSAGSTLWTRMTGVREVAVGAGTSIAAGEGTGAGWISMAALVDLGDGALALCSRGVPVRTRVFGLAAAGLGVAQLQLARRLAEAERGEAVTG